MWELAGSFFSEQEEERCFFLLRISRSGKQGGLSLIAFGGKRERESGHRGEGCVVLPERLIACLEGSLELRCFSGGQDPSDHHKTRFCLCC